MLVVVYTILSLAVVKCANKTVSLKNWNVRKEEKLGMSLGKNE